MVFDTLHQSTAQSTIYNNWTRAPPTFYSEVPNPYPSVNFSPNDSSARLRCRSFSTIPNPMGFSLFWLPPFYTAGIHHALNARSPVENSSNLSLDAGTPCALR